MCFERSAARAMLLSCAVWCALGGVAQAQLPMTRLYAVFPSGGKVGGTVELQVTSGDDLDELRELVFDHPGIKGVHKADRTFEVTIDGAVAPGVYEVRAVGLFGMSNSRTFVVGDRDEIREAEPNNTPEQATGLELNQIVNGRADSATDVDHYKFSGKAGQRVLADCRAVRIDSRMSAVLELYDASGKRLAHTQDRLRPDPLLDVTLPADGEYVLKVYDSLYGGGPEYGYRLAVGTQPHVDFVLPPAGLPGSTATYTLYGRNLPEGQPARVSIDGRPLQKRIVQITLPEQPDVLQAERAESYQVGVDAISYTLETPAGKSNAVPIFLATSPTVIESEPNDSPEHAQRVLVPAEIGGQFQEVGDVDYFTFDAKAGEVFIVEAFGHRSGSTADPFFVLEQVTRNEKGEEQVKQITAQDDTGTNLAPNVFDTITDDPVFRFQVPADGTYRLTLKDRYFESRGDPRLVYRLAIRREQPDFRLVAVPFFPVQQTNQPVGTASISLRKGDNFAVQVVAFRRDGFDGPIEVAVEGLPDGVSCPGAVVGTGENGANLIFTTAENAAEWSGTVQIVGKARIGEAEVRRAARIGTVVWNGQGTARLAKSIGVSVMKEAAPLQVATELTRVQAHQGRQILVPVKVARRNGFDNNVALTVEGLPQNSNVQFEAKPIEKGQSEALLRMFVNANAKPGTYTITLRSQAQVAYSRNAEAAERAKQALEAATKSSQAAAEAAKTAAQERDAAVQKLAQQTDALNKARAAKAEVEKQLAPALEAVRKAESEATAADEAAKTDALNRLTAALESARKAAESLAAGRNAVAQAAAAAKAAEETKAQAEGKIAAAEAEAKKAEEARKAAEKAATDAANAAKPTNVNVFPPSTPIILEVKPAPVELSASVPNGGALKRGEKLEIKVSVKRVNGFAGPVTLTLPLPPNAAGITAEPVTIAADQSEGVLTVQAAADATEGQLANMVVRAMMDFGGEAAVDVPVAINVSK